MDLLSEKGSGYQGNRAPDFLLSNDRWSQILNFRYGPDGQVAMRLSPTRALELAKELIEPTVQAIKVEQWGEDWPG